MPAPTIDRPPVHTDPTPDVRELPGWMLTVVLVVFATMVVALLAVLLGVEPASPDDGEPAQPAPAEPAAVEQLGLVIGD